MSGAEGMGVGVGDERHQGREEVWIEGIEEGPGGQGGGEIMGVRIGGGIVGLFLRAGGSC